MQRGTWQIPRVEIELKVPGGLKSTYSFRGESCTERKLQRAVEGPLKQQTTNHCVHVRELPETE